MQTVYIGEINSCNFKLSDFFLLCDQQDSGDKKFAVFS